MPVTSGQGSDVESQIYTYLTKNLGFNTAAACGILANIEIESGGFKYDHNNGEGIIDSNGKPSYGLCMWNDTRFTDLKNYCSKNNMSYRSVSGQLSFLAYELTTNSYLKSNVYDALKGYSNDAQGAYNAGYTFCYHFERPRDQVGQSKSRGASARDRYFPYYSKNGSSESSNSISNLGQRIVQIARQQKGKKYVLGGNGPDIFDCSGLVYYCYNKAGYSLPDMTADGYYQKFKNSARKVSPSDTLAADLLFYENNSSQAGLDHIAIANGSGGIIHAANPSRGVVEDSGLSNPTYILRVLSDSETSQGDVPEGDISGGLVDSSGGMSPLTYSYLTADDPYAMIMRENLSKVEAAGYDYGYLIDMDHGGEFKFYIPEYSEQAGANWGDIEIRGRSVTVKTYESTNSRNITISLDLYAGVGLYEATSDESGEDTVSRLHKDMYFVKSLEYPDYTNVITRPPSVVHLILGSAINIAGVVTGVVVEHMKPLDQYNRAMYVRLSFSVLQIATNPIDYRDVRNGQYALIDTNYIDSLLIGENNSVNTNTPVYAGGSGLAGGIKNPGKKKNNTTAGGSGGAGKITEEIY